MNPTDILGWIATVLASICFLPQIIKIIKEKSTKDLSLFMVLLMGSNNVCWIIFGILDDNIQLITTNSIIVSMMVVILAFKIYFVSIKKETFMKPKYENKVNEQLK